MKQPVLVKPVMTEKSLKDKKTYVFLVLARATKKEIKAEIESLYKGVEVATVRTVVLKGKVKTVGRRRMKKALPMRKKAYISLQKGEINDIKVQ